MKNTLLALLFLVLAVSPSTTQEEGQASPGSLQSMARQQLSRLVETLSKLSIELKSTDPDKSSLLKSALQYCGEKQIEGRMREIQQLLKEKRFQDSLDKMAKIEEDLTNLLDLLLSRNKALLELLKKIDQLEAFRREADQIIKEQEELRDQAQKALDLKALHQDMESASNALADLAQQESVLANKPSFSKMDAKRQAQLKERTQALEKELERIGKEQNRLTGNSGALSASKSTGKAAKAMSKAEEAMNKGNSAKGGEMAAKASRDLDDAKKKLDAEKEKVKAKIHKLNLADQALKQKQNAQKTQDLAEKLKKSEAEGLPPSGSGAMGEAVPHQNKASGQLEKKSPEQAVPEQDQALDKMKKSKEEIEKSLEQERRRLQEEMLRALEERIAGILAQQKRITAATRVLHQPRNGADRPPRAVRLKAKKLGEQEAEASGQAALARRLLREEGSTVIIPEILGTVIDSLDTIANDLALARTGPSVQSLQDEVEAFLIVILEAIRKEQEDRDDEDSEQEPQDQEPQDQPLVPRAAELKMIRTIQQAVYKATLKANILAETKPKEGARWATRLAQKQGLIFRLTKKLATRIDKDIAEEEDDNQ